MAGRPEEDFMPRLFLYAIVLISRAAARKLDGVGRDWGEDKVLHIGPEAQLAFFEHTENIEGASSATSS